MGLFDTMIIANINVFSLSQNFTPKKGWWWPTALTTRIRVLEIYLNSEIWVVAILNLEELKNFCKLLKFNTSFKNFSAEFVGSNGSNNQIIKN